MRRIIILLCFIICMANAEDVALAFTPELEKPDEVRGTNYFQIKDAVLSINDLTKIENSISVGMKELTGFDADYVISIREGGQYWVDVMTSDGRPAKIKKFSKYQVTVQYIKSYKGDVYDLYIGGFIFKLDKDYSVLWKH